MSLGPEARATAQSVFGRNLENLESVDQLSDFVEMFEVLGETLGVEFDILNDDDDDDDGDDDDADQSIIDDLFGQSFYTSASTSVGGGGRSSSNRSRATASSRAANKRTPSTGQNGPKAPASQGGSRNWQADVDWDTFVADFDSGRSPSSRMASGRAGASSRGGASAGSRTSGGVMSSGQRGKNTASPTSGPRRGSGGGRGAYSADEESRLQEEMLQEMLGVLMSEDDDDYGPRSTRKGRKSGR